MSVPYAARINKIKILSTMENLFTSLKQNTVDSHQLLETTAPFNTMLKPGLFSQQSYTANLSILASFHEYVAVKIEPNSEARALTDYLQPELTLGTIKQDLQQLAVPSFAPPFTAPIDSHNMADLIGASYVWMGSSMGAKMLHRWLNQQGYAHLPCAYYAHMSSLGRQWRDYQQCALALAASHTIDHQRCIASANGLFEALIECARQYSARTQNIL